MSNIKRSAAALLALAIALSQVACTTGQIVGGLSLAVDAYAAYASDTGHPVDAAFANAAHACLDGATTELATSDTGLQKFTSITAGCALAGAGTPGLSPGGVALVNAIGDFLAQLKTIEAFTLTNKKYADAFNAPDKPEKITKKQLAKIAKKLAAAKAKLATRK